jgi:hypothetical protein
LDLLLNVAPEYAIFVTIENGKKVLYVVPSAGRGGGRGSARGRGGFRHQTPSTPKKSAFAGTVNGLEGAVFDLSEGSQQAIQYEETLKAIWRHVGNTYENGADVTSSIDNDLTMIVIDVPADLPANASAASQRIWNKKCDMVPVAEDKLERNIKRLYALVLAQSSDPRSASTLSSTPWQPRGTVWAYSPSSETRCRTTRKAPTAPIRAGRPR